MTTPDYLVIGLYFAFILILGYAFRTFSSNTSDYFRGGGLMLWWMAGSSAFMTQFSAWTFIGAAGKAYLDGPIVLTVFLANAVGFMVNYWVFAARMRQTRLVTGIEVIRQRFGKGAEQLFTWLEIPIGLTYASIWLNALGQFLTQAFPGFGLEATILATGLVVLLVSLLGGAWAVSATDFIQLTLLMLLAVVTAAFSLWEVGGPVQLAREFPVDSLFGRDINLPLLGLTWIALVFLKQVLNTNKMTSAHRYLNARDSGEARKAALLAAVLFCIGSVVWFIPPMAGAVLYPDLGAYLPASVSRPEELAYAVVAQNVLPAGMVGLLVVAIFAATMSSMDSGLNRNTGIFVLNFYKPIVRPQASEKELFFVSRLATLILGFVIIGMAIFLERLMGKHEGFGLFELMLSFGAMVAVPIGIPIIFGLFVKRIPDWSCWTCALVGLLGAFLSQRVFTAEWFQAWAGLEFTTRERSDYGYCISFLCGAALPMIWLFVSRYFYREPSGERARELEEFWNRVETPVAPSEAKGDRNYAQCRLIGLTAYAFGLFLFLLAIFAPNEWLGRLAFVFCAAVLGLIGWLLLRTARRFGAPPLLKSAEGSAS
jgi:SSS family transporter